MSHKTKQELQADVDQLRAELHTERADGAHLRGQIFALERIVEAYRAGMVGAPLTVPPLTPFDPVAPQLPTWPPAIAPAPWPRSDHGGNCACSQCVKITCGFLTYEPDGTTTFTAADGTVTKGRWPMMPIEVGRAAFPIDNLVIGGPQRPSGQIFGGVALPSTSSAH